MLLLSFSSAGPLAVAGSGAPRAVAAAWLRLSPSRPEMERTTLAAALAREWGSHPALLRRGSRFIDLAATAAGLVKPTTRDVLANKDVIMPAPYSRVHASSIALALTSCVFRQMPSLTRRSRRSAMRGLLHRVGFSRRCSAN